MVWGGSWGGGKLRGCVFKKLLKFCVDVCCNLMGDI